MTATMRAVVLDGPGPPEALQIRELPVPELVLTFGSADGPTCSAATVGGRTVAPFDSASTRGRSECRRPSARR
jgi:hypothetical protein